MAAARTEPDFPIQPTGPDVWKGYDALPPFLLDEVLSRSPRGPGVAELQEQLATNGVYQWTSATVRVSGHDAFRPAEWHRFWLVPDTGDWVPSTKNTMINTRLPMMVKRAVVDKALSDIYARHDYTPSALVDFDGISQQGRVYAFIPRKKTHIRDAYELVVARYDGSGKAVAFTFKPDPVPSGNYDERLGINKARYSTTVQMFENADAEIVVLGEKRPPPRETTLRDFT